MSVKSLLFIYLLNCNKVTDKILLSVLWWHIHNVIKCLVSNCCSLRDKIAKLRYLPLEVFRMASSAPAGKAGAKAKVL